MAMNRRSFLRGSTGACISLPLLESLGGAARGASAHEAPMRLFFMSHPFGRTAETFYPDPADVGTGYTLTPGLKHLAAHKGDFTFISNLTNQHQAKLPSAAHASSTIMLTGADIKAKGGYFDNTVSCDQLLGEHLGQDVRYKAIAIDGGGGFGHGEGGSLSWAVDGSPIYGETDPVKLYNRFFVNEDVNVVTERLRRKQSVLDTALGNAKAVHNKVSSADQRKLDEYFQSIRQIEQGLERERTWMTVPKPDAPKLELVRNVQAMEELKLVYDLMILAMQTDSTRVWTYRMPDKALFSVVAGEGLPTGHPMSHYYTNPSPIYKEGSVRQDEVYAELVAYCIERLKSTQDIDGQPMFNNVIGNFGSSLRTGHTSIDTAMIVFGGGKGTMRLGQHIAGKSKSTPMTNLWVSQMQAAGMEVDSFSDSTGTISDLLA